MHENEISEKLIECAIQVHQIVNKLKEYLYETLRDSAYSASLR